MKHTSFILADLELAYITCDDLPALIEILKKETVCQYLSFGPSSERQTRDYFEPFIEDITLSLAKDEKPTSHVFIIHRKNTRIGYSTLLPVAFSKGHYTLGYILDEPFWRQGIASAVCRFLVDFGLSTLAAYRISADCMGGNISSRRILEKNGFILEGCQKNYWHKNGTFQDSLLFGLLRR